MNSGGWRYLPPVLQTKHNFYLCSDLWLLQRGAWDGEGAGAGQGMMLHPWVLPEDRALFLFVPAGPQQH